MRESMSRPAGMRAERTRRAITTAAEDLFLGRGFLGTSMDDVAATAEVSKQTVYAHFHSKEALFLEVVRGMTGAAGDEFEEQVADPGAEPPPLEEFLRDFAVRQLTIVMTPRLMQVRRLVIAEAERFPELGKALYEKGPGRSIGRLVGAFARYPEQIRAADPRKAAAFFNWLVMAEPTNDAMMLGDGAIPDGKALVAHAEEAVRIFLAAYGSNSPP
jgi:TetR/AcrR family transcriptional regulator, mexJK operon transcriptional repressor